MAPVVTVDSLGCGLRLITVDYLWTVVTVDFLWTVIT